MANAPVDVKPLFPIFKQQWQTLSFPIHAPCDELHFGRLMRATVVHSDDNIKLGMLRSLPMRPIWVEDPGMMVALAACFRTPTFHWDNTRSVGQLPPHEAFNFILEHYTVFEQLAVPMWMWLAIYVQAVSAEESLLLPSSSPGRLDPQLNWVETLSAISTPNSYNSVPERNKISAWFRRRVVPDALRGAVRQKTMFPAIYNSRYAPVSLATFIAAIQGGWSFDDLYYARIAAPSPLPLAPRSPVDTVAHYSYSPPPPPISSLQADRPHSLRTFSEAVPHSSPHAAPPAFLVQNDSAEEETSPDGTASSSYALRELASEPSTSRTPDDPGSPYP
jgi:hypothetical protein